MNRDKIVQYIGDRLKRRCMKRYGIEAMNHIFEISHSMGRTVWLDYGTLLGAYREHGFIKHDIDIDVAMYGKDFDYSFERALYDRGFKMLRQFRLVQTHDTTQRLTTEMTLKYKQLTIDVFFKFQDEGRTFGYLWGNADPQHNVWKAYRDYFNYSGFKEIDFLGITVHVPKNTKEFLEYKYGDDFMTPQPGWQPPKKVYLPLEECYGEVIGGWIG